jgi:hypothetical protein
MIRFARLSHRCAMTALLCLSACASSHLIAFAADTRDVDNSSVMPISLSYPFAAPGSLDLYHWTDATMTKLAPGPVTVSEPWPNRAKPELRRDMHDMDKISANMSTVPTFLDYPVAPPDSIAQYRRAILSIRQPVLTSAPAPNVADQVTAEIQRMREILDQMRSSLNHFFVYPTAAPGSLMEPQTTGTGLNGPPGGIPGGDNYVDVPVQIVQQNGVPITAYQNLFVVYIPSYFYGDLPGSATARHLSTTIPVTAAGLNLSLIEYAEYRIWVSNTSNETTLNPVSNVATRRSYDSHQITLKLLH